MKLLKISLMAVLGLGLATTAFAAKKDKSSKKDVDELPSEVFHMGKLLTPLASIPLKTAEIVAYMPQRKKLFVVGEEKLMEVVSLSNPEKPKVEGAMRLAGHGSSVTVNGDYIAVSEIADVDGDSGYVEIFRFEKDAPKRLGTYRVCPQPDMITYTPDGKMLLAACEGSPNKDFTEDPDGGVAIITRGLPIEAFPDSFPMVVYFAGFENLDSTALAAKGVRMVGPNSFSQSLEPEYITVSDDSKMAWVSLQENNAIAKIDLSERGIYDVFALGTVDHSKPGFGIDVRNNGEIQIENLPIHGLRQPDGIAHFSVGDKHYIVTANEGAPVNDYEDWTDVTDALSLFEKNRLEESAFDGKTLSKIGKLSVSSLERCDALWGKCPYVHSFGTRSISIFDGETGELVWDSGDQIEQMLAKVAPKYFNWNAKKNKSKKDNRSGDKGCEPENVVVGNLGKHRLAFVGLERMSGIVVFNLTNLEKPKIVDYYMDTKDRGPEGLLFIDAEHSPIPGQALLVVGYEYSKTLTIYKVR